MENSLENAPGKNIESSSEDNEGKLKSAQEIATDKLTNKEEMGFEGVQSFEDLYRLIDEEDSLEGSEKSYEAPELKELIDKVINGEAGLNFITRTGGLRSKVHELLTEKFSFNKAESFDELIASLDKYEKIPGSKEGWYVKEIKDYIDDIRNGRVLNRLTRVCGLRDKVSELLKNEIKK